MAVMHWVSFQPPRPSLASDEILGTWNVPKAVGSARPPPRRVASSCFGVAWHDEQPPIRNIVRPFSRFGVCVGGTKTALGDIASGGVRYQKAGTPMTSAAMASTSSLRSIRPAPANGHSPDERSDPYVIASRGDSPCGRRRTHFRSPERRRAGRRASLSLCRDYRRRLCRTPPLSH